MRGENIFGLHKIMYFCFVFFQGSKNDHMYYYYIQMNESWVELLTTHWLVTITRRHCSIWMDQSVKTLAATDQPKRSFKGVFPAACCYAELRCNRQVGMFGYPQLKHHTVNTGTSERRLCAQCILCVPIWSAHPEVALNDLWILGDLTSSNGTSLHCSMVSSIESYV